MIVLDTHALLWWVNGDSALSKNALAAIENELEADVGEILISSITAWEIAMLVDKGRIALSMGVDDWMATVKQIQHVHFVPIDISTAVESTRLPGEFHKDPADRMIVALARHFNAALVTADEKINNYRHVKTVW